MSNALDRNMTVAQIVTEHPASARIFRERGIDFCCAGKVTVDEACAKRGLDAAIVRGELERALGDDDARRNGGDARALSNTELMARIVDTHHRYTRTVLPHVRAMAEKVARVHGDRNPKLVELRDTVIALGDVLLPHLDDEERELFPMLATGRDPDGARTRALRDMETEHREVGELLGTMRRQADNFTTPDWGCATYRTLFAELSSLEDDLLRHIHLENHVLAPRFGT